MLAHLFDGLVRSDQLVAVREVDPVVALRDDGRRRDAHVHLGGAGVEKHLDDLPRCVAAHDRIIDDDQAFARHFGQRVELQPDALFAQALVRLDERPPDVPVLDQPFAERNVQRARESDRRWRSRVGDRKNEVGISR